MALVQKLELRQGQQLVMTPQLQQAIRLLQLSNVELCAFVEAEVERNPLLESEQVAPEPPPDAPAAHGKDDEDADEAGGGGSGDWPDGEATMPLNGSRHQATEASGPLQRDGADGSGWTSLRQRSSNAFDVAERNLADLVAAGRSLADHLTDKQHVIVIDPVERLIGAHLIHMVDDAGYLRGDLDDLAAKLGAPAGLTAKVLETLQGFDPPGVLARDLA